MRSIEFTLACDTPVSLPHDDFSEISVVPLLHRVAIGKGGDEAGLPWWDRTIIDNWYPHIDSQKFPDVDEWLAGVIVSLDRVLQPCIDDKQIIVVDRSIDAETLDQFGNFVDVRYYFRGEVADAAAKWAQRELSRDLFAVITDSAMAAGDAMNGIG